MEQGLNSRSHATIGLSPGQQWRYFEQRPFTREEREHTTVLFGGLTEKHERLVRGALTALGYRAEIVPTPTVEDFQTGKEYGNYGQCCPTYFTVGSLVNHLKALERAGRSRREIVEDFVYITPSSPCGPCRLGMYQNEYRLATSNSGFEGFRVIPFQQTPRISGDSDAGLDVNVDFSFALLFAILLGDVINDVAYRLRPFEAVSGETDGVVESSLARLESVVAGLAFPALGESRRWRRRLDGLFPGAVTAIEVAVKLHRWLRGEHLEKLLCGLRQVADGFEAIEVDRTRVKPIVKITGEFWAQTTEGDGNYGMFRFLEKEGAEVIVEPVATWFYYLLQVARHRNLDTAGIVAKDESDITPVDRTAASWRRAKRSAVLNLIDRFYIGLFDRMRAALLEIPHALIDQRALEDLASPYYHSRLRGGEGHLEVGKNIYYHVHHLAHMVLSLKPFGCMPSTQSDAVQASTRNAFGDMIFLPIETSGEGKVNALSRVQMALGEAKQKAKSELELALSRTGLGLNEVREFANAHPELKRPSYRVPRNPETIGTAANFVYHVHRLRNGSSHAP